MIEKPNKLQPALFGGLIIGVLSSIPLVNAGNLCCCLWVLLGGAIAARMLIKRSAYLPVTTGEGAKVGAIAGVVSAGVILVVSVPLNLLLGSSNTQSLREIADATDNLAFREGMLQVTAMMQDHPVLFALCTWFVTSILYVAFASIGGMIGVAMFEKRKGQQPPAPGYGGAGFPPPGSPPPPGQAPYGQGPPPSY